MPRASSAAEGARPGSISHCTRTPLTSAWCSEPIARVFSSSLSSLALWHHASAEPVFLVSLLAPRNGAQATTTSSAPISPPHGGELLHECPSHVAGTA